MADDMVGPYDVVVVGGGAAGLSGALMLARSRRSVLVIDAGEPRNSPATAVHGFLSRDGVAPAELTGIGRSEVRSYGAHIINGEAVSAAGARGRFTVTLGDGRTVRARRLLVTTGLVDELPDVAGVAGRWGRDVLHCPYCHGWEVRDQAVGILGTGPMAVHQAFLFRQLTPDVTLFVHTAPAPTATEVTQLAARNITVIDGEVESLEIADDRLTGVRLHSGRVIPRQAVVIGTRLVARSDVLTTLGLEPTAHPLGVGEYVAGDPSGLTAVPGVWVAGNVTDLMAQVVSAAAAGAGAGAAINADLIAEEVQRAVDDPFSNASEARMCETVMGDRRHGL